MKRPWKEDLRQAFEAPEPLRKEEFLQRFAKPSMSSFEFVRIQLMYIRKWIWVLSATIFIISLAAAACLKVDMVWVISALTPILALTIISESGRSQTYEMAELEMATQFSLKSVILARLGIVGIENVVLLCLMVPIGILNSVVSPLQAGLYIVVPFLLTTFCGLYTVRRFRGREASYICTGIACIVSFSMVFCHGNLPEIYEETYVIWWIAAVIILGAETGKQCYKMINRMEELA